VHPYAIATSMVQPSAVSRWTALSHHGLTTQLPWTVTVTSPKTVMTPSMRRPDRGHHRAPVGHTWLVGDVTIQFVKVREDRFFGVEVVWVDQQFRVPVFDRERTVLDLFAYPRAFGGLDTALAVLREYGRELDLDRLIAYSLRYASKAVNGRVGWSLEEVGLNAPGVEELRLHVGPGLQLLDPTRPAHGRRDGRWFVLDNISPRSAD
jgi:predicted transcriptional regulator of viral defense system